MAHSLMLAAASLAQPFHGTPKGYEPDAAGDPGRARNWGGYGRKGKRGYDP